MKRTIPHALLLLFLSSFASADTMYFCKDPNDPNASTVFSRDPCRMGEYVGKSEYDNTPIDPERSTQNERRWRELNDWTNQQIEERTRVRNQIILIENTRQGSRRRTRTSSQPIYSSGTSSYATEPQQLLDPYTGNIMPRTSAGYTDTSTGTFYNDVGGGVVNTRTGEFTPTH